MNDRHMSIKPTSDFQKLSALTVSGVRQHRRGTLVPLKKKSYAEGILTPASVSEKHSGGSIDFNRKLSWLENTRKRSVFGKVKGNVIFEGHFPEYFRGLYCSRFSPESEQFALAFGAGAIQVWGLNSEDYCINVRKAPQHGFPITCLRFIPNISDTYFAASTCGILFLCGTKAGQCTNFVKEENNEINSVDCSADGSTVVTVGKDAAVRIYDITTQKLISHLAKDALTATSAAWKFHVMRVFTVKFHPEMNDVFLTGGWDDVVKIWDAREKDGCVKFIKGPHICGESVDVKENTVLTGSWTVKNSLQLWDLPSGSLIDTITPSNRQSSIDGEFLYCAQYYKADPSGNTIVIGGSGLCNVEVIDIVERKVMANFRVNKSIQAIDTSSKYLVFGGMETTFRVATYQV